MTLHIISLCLSVIAMILYRSFKNDNAKFINVVKIMRKITGKIDRSNIFNCSFLIIMEMPKRENRDARKLRSINIIGCKILSSLNVNLMEILTL